MTPLPRFLEKPAYNRIAARVGHVATIRARRHLVIYIYDRLTPVFLMFWRGNFS